MNLTKTGFINSTKVNAEYDSDHHRFVLKPLLPGATMSLNKAFVAIIKTGKGEDLKKMTWKKLGDFCKVTQSEAFKIAYCSPAHRCVVRRTLQPYLVIDAINNCAYFYHRDYLPEDIKPTHVGPSIINTESTDAQVIVEKIPTKVTSRVKINYPYTDSLIMTLQPTNGYLLGVRDITLAQPNHTYVVTGSARTLTDLLRKMNFVGVTPGDASIIISVDDGEKTPTSVVSTTVVLNVTEGVRVSVPQLILPENPAATLHMESAFDAIQVQDDDNKYMQLRITPFGCKIINFNNSLQPLLPGNVRNIYGCPETINADIAHLAIVPSQSNAQIGLELICDTTRILKYVVFDVTDTSAAEPVAAMSLEDEPVAQAEAPTPVTISWAGPELSGVEGTESPLAMVIEADAVAPVTLKPINCTLTHTETGTKTIHNKTLTVTGDTVAAINAELSKYVYTLGSKSGRIDVSYGDHKVSIPTTVVPPEA